MAAYGHLGPHYRQADKCDKDGVHNQASSTTIFSSRNGKTHHVADTHCRASSSENKT
jgi:hypothetical protein